MREIKFRGKSLDNKEWWYGSLVIIHGRYFIFNDDGRYDVAPATVGQYTGLKDRNGKEIYEGDIFKTGDSYKLLFLIEWDKENARYLGRDIKGNISYIGREPAIEVCGNIHDQNSKKLEGKK